MFETLEIFAAAETLLASIRMRGFTCRQTSDFEEVRSVLHQMGAFGNDTDADQYVTKFLDPYRTPVTREHSYWLFLMKDGQPVGKMATRLDRLGEESFKSFATRAIMSVHPEDRAMPPEDRFPEIAERIRGNVAYCGDLYMAPKVRRDVPVTEFIDLNYLLMYMRWGAPDYTVCYVRERDGLKWNWMEPHWNIERNTLSFSHPSSSQKRDIWMGWLPRENFLRIVEEARTELPQQTQAFHVA